MALNGAGWNVYILINVEKVAETSHCVLKHNGILEYIVGMENLIITFVYVKEKLTLDVFNERLGFHAN